MVASLDPNYFHLALKRVRAVYDSLNYSVNLLDSVASIDSTFLFYRRTCLTCLSKVFSAGIYTNMVNKRIQYFAILLKMQTIIGNSS